MTDKYQNGREDEEQQKHPYHEFLQNIGHYSSDPMKRFRSKRESVHEEIKSLYKERRSRLFPPGD